LKNVTSSSLSLVALVVCSSASEYLSSEVLLHEAPKPGLLGTGLASHRPIDRLSVSYFAAQTDFVTIALKHNLVTIALKHFSARGALGSKNTPGWLTEESVLAVFRC
jgi:hypothetical protein